MHISSPGPLAQAGLVMAGSESARHSDETYAGQRALDRMPHLAAYPVGFACTLARLRPGQRSGSKHLYVRWASVS